MRVPAIERVALLVVLAATAAAAASCGGSKPAASCERFCLTVEPSGGDTRTIFTFQGRGWEPRSSVRASYGPYCPPQRVCAAVLFTRAIPTGADGSFSFGFRNGPASLRLRGRERGHGVGGGPVRFSQRAGPPGQRRLVRRTAHYTVDGVRY